MMKKILVSLFAFLLCLSALAVPAKKGVFTYTQPDGSVVRLERHGDEFFSWNTLAGTNQVVELDEKGYYRNSTLDPAIQKMAAERRRQINRQRAAISPRTHDESKKMTHGERHIPVILANFSDVSYILDNPQQRFNALLNENGYSYNGAVGSVQDYYVSNSHGAFTPIFDVYGPVTLPNDMAYYGAPVRQNGRIVANDVRPEWAIYDACLLLDATVDFSQYDYDNDGYVDMILFYYPGYNTAEGGSQDAIWPHSWNVSNGLDANARKHKFDGLKLGSYFCTSELKGYRGSTMCSIGTTCHEFGHSLGMPDFYDTDYTDNGYAAGLDDFALMSSGSYNKDGNVPPYLCAEEKIYLGWMTQDDIQDLPEGAISFGSIKDEIAFKTETSVEGEYFLYECRDGSGWDASLPQGLLVYHIDKSTVRTVGGITPYDHWAKWSQYNRINADGYHPCGYIVPAADQGNLNYQGSMTEWMFPGSKNLTTYMPIDWDNNVSASISGISFADGKVSLSTHYLTEKCITGRVIGLDNQPVGGVTITLSTIEASQVRKPAVFAQSAIRETVSGDMGDFYLSLEGIEAQKVHLSFSKEGYQSTGQDVEVPYQVTTVELVISKQGETGVTDYYYYDPSGQAYLIGYSQFGASQMAAIHIPSRDLNENGGRLISVTYCPYTPAEAYYLIVDTGQERLVTYQIPDEKGGIYETRTVDLTQMNITFPPHTELYVGLAIKNAGGDYSQYPFIGLTGGSNTFYAPFNLQESNWRYPEQDALGLQLIATIIGQDDSGESEYTSFSQMGFTTIHDPGKGVYKAGDVFLLQLDVAEGETAPLLVMWKIDGQNASEAVTLTPGKHLIKAITRYENEEMELLELSIEAK